MPACRFHELIHLFACGARSEWRRLAWRVFSGKYAVGKRRESEIADSVAGACGEHFCLRFAPQHGVLQLARTECGQIVATANCCRGFNLLRGPFAKSNSADLARFHRSVKRGESLFERSFLVKSMALVKIDGVDAQPFKRTVELLFDLRGREPVVRIVSDREVELSCDQILVARVCTECLAECALGLACAVLIRGVEESYSMLNRGVDTANRLIVRDATRHREPRAKTQF